jgi:hypothetical protein
LGLSGLQGWSLVPLVLWEEFEAELLRPASP